MGITQSDVDALLAAAEGLAGEADSGDAGGCADTVEEPSEPQPAPPPAAAPRRKPNRSSLRRTLTLSVPVIVKLAGQEMPVSKVLDFKIGSIIEFDQVFDADLELIVGNQVIGLGQAVKAGENFGLRITQIGRVQDTIRALGAKE